MSASVPADCGLSAGLTYAAVIQRAVATTPPMVLKLTSNALRVDVLAAASFGPLIRLIGDKRLNFLLRFVFDIEFNRIIGCTDQILPSP